ncbi:hypothetical protein FGO68_gene17481 [Halteria grandinella]|uniref:Uncharacterized protein n=1 Tax=Halteria grandinella TaxID=5974 RepID=A0A8J8NLM9_HALGN|nr:hypothetical protein FGO68_gene17481 [Halteria grandinella]
MQISKTELLIYQIIQAVELLLGWTLLAFFWGRATKYVMHRKNMDNSKFFTFLLIGVALLANTFYRFQWDYINYAYLSYMNRSLWGKETYEWYQDNQKRITGQLQVLSFIKLWALSSAFMLHMRRWIIALRLQRAHGIIENCFFAECILCYGSMAVVLLGGGKNFAPLIYPHIEHFLVKPVIIVAFIVLLKQAQVQDNKHSRESGLAIGCICQFLAVSIIRYLITYYCSPSDYSDRFRLYYLSFIGFYQPSFLLMIGGLCQSVKAIKRIEDRNKIERSIDMVNIGAKVEGEKTQREYLL